MYDPKGESASTTRAATAKASSNAIRDDGRKVGMIRSEHYCSCGPAPVVDGHGRCGRGAAAGSGLEVEAGAESPRGSASSRQA
jgi:hypothetical protein